MKRCTENSTACVARPRRLPLVTVGATLAVTLAAGVSQASDHNEPGRLIAALSGDWNGDGNPDALLLVQGPEGMADLVVHEGDGIFGLHPVLTLRDVIFAGPMAGQTPGLEARSQTSFAITQTQTGVGRHAWTSAITVAYRGAGYTVAGFTHRFHDRLDLSHHGSCDVNLLTGDYQIVFGPGDEAPERRESGRGAHAAFPLADLAEGYAAPACTALFR